jgi:hypothetical protein
VIANTVSYTLRFFVTTIRLTTTVIEKAFFQQKRGWLSILISVEALEGPIAVLSEQVFGLPSICLQQTKEMPAEKQGLPSVVKAMPCNAPFA